METAVSAGWRSRVAGALEGAAFTVPISLGSVTLVFSKVGPEALSAAVFATLVALAWIHLVTVRSRRPALYSARFFEATTLAAMLEQIIPRLPAWSLPDTSGVRLALLAVLVAGAGVSMGVLYLLRADRFTRFIPAPVFAGFSTSIAVVLVVTQTQALAGMLATASALVVLTIAGVAFVGGFAVRRWMPQWPASALALGVSLLVGAAWVATGHGVSMLGLSTPDARLPWMMADFAALRAPGVPVATVAGVLAGHAAVLGTMMFVNTTLSAQLLSHADGRKRDSSGLLLWTAGHIAACGAAGAAPLSGSVQSSSAAVRHAPLEGTALICTALVMAAIAASGFTAWIPLAAVSGALLCEAWFMVDRPSLRSLRRWLAREPLQGHAREDLAVICVVVLTAVAVNMIAAVFAGLLLGLLLFAARSARRPVRRVLTGAQLSSNCARPRGDMRTLSQYGERLRILELERDLFFGAVESLERTLVEQLNRAECLVIDWTQVRHLDSSAAQAVAKFQRSADLVDVPVFHVEPALGSEAHASLGQYLHTRRGAPDLDHALELAENHLLALHGRVTAPETTSMLEAASLLQGLAEPQRALVERAMQQRIVPRGQPLVTAGEPGSELLLVLHGSASVVLPGEHGVPMRVAGVRRGATVGEMGFLDGSPRSATVVADEDTLVAVLTTEAFERLGREDPPTAQRIVVNIALDVATRLRHSNRLAATRQSRQ